MFILVHSNIYNFILLQNSQIYSNSQATEREVFLQAEQLGDHLKEILGSLIFLKLTQMTGQMSAIVSLLYKIFDLLFGHFNLTF